MSSKNYKKRSSSSEDTETRKRKRDQKYNSDNENKSARRDREDDDDTYKSKEKESRSKDKIKSEREKRSRSRDRHKIARDRSRDRLKPRDGRNRDRTRSSRDERERSRERSKSKEKSKSFRDERTKSRERSKSMERNKSSRDGRGKDESWSNDRNRFRRRRDSIENDNSYRGRNDDRTRYWDRDAEGRDMNMYRDRQRNLSEERHQQVVQSSYYGTELKNNNEDPKNKKDGSENKKEDDKLENENKEANNPEVIPPKQKKTVDLLTSRTGGAYIPPAKLRMMQAEINDKSGVAYQRIAWEALKKSIHGYINKVNTSNIGPITRELLKENIVRGRGLLARSIIQAQAASLTFTPVYAALVAVINSKFPNIGELILKRLAIQFKRGFRRDDKAICISSTTFIAHLVNQQVAHEILILEILTLLIQSPTDDSIEVAIAILKECGMKLTILCKKGIETIFEMLRNILHEGSLDKRVQYMIEVMFQIRKDGFKDYESVHKELDLVEEEDQITHLVNLDDANDGMDILNVFKFDAEYIANEDKYKELSKEILNSDDEDDDEENDSDEEEEGDSDENSDGEKADNNIIVDNTETNLTALRRTIYLTIHSSLDFEECAHKLMKMQLKPGQEIEMCHMFLDCCAEMRTYEKFFGLLAGRFCAINKIYVQPFQEIFRSSYDTIHRLETNKLRNVSKFFAHLLMTDSISWEVLAHIKLNEEDTTSSSRVFIKILFQELSEYMGLPKLNEKLKNEELQEAFSGLFPKDDPKNTRFAINFFTSIGLGGLTDDLREHLKNRPKAVPEAVVETRKEKSSSSSSSSSESSSTSSSSSESSSSDSESSEDDKRRKRKDKGRKKKAVVVKRRDGKEKNKSDRNKREKRESPKVKRHDKKQKKTKRR